MRSGSQDHNNSNAMKQTKTTAAKQQKSLEIKPMSQQHGMEVGQAMVMQRKEKSQLLISM